MRRAVIALAVLSAAALPAASHAQTACDKADARCLLVLNLAAAQSTQNPQQREKASQGVYYYTGRLNAHGARIGALLIGEAKAITSPQQAQAELTRCGNELTARSAELRNGLIELQNAGRAETAARAAAQPAAPPPKK
jgi:Tfp pilus assembly protein PilV